MGFALAAGASDAFPVAGMVAVPMVQAAMLRQLAKLFGVDWDKRAYTEFAAALGAGTLVRTASSFGVRQLVKLHSRLRTDRGRRRRGRSELRRHLRHGPGRHAFPAAAPAGAAARRSWRPSIARRCSEAFGLAKARDVGPRGGSQPMSDRQPAMGIPRIVLLVVALLLPTLSLLPLGTLWLWEHGYLIYWAIATCVAVIAVYFLQRRLIVPLPAEALARETHEPGDPSWTPRQIEAWADVMRLADTVRADRIASRDAALSLGLETVEVVAKRLHPERGEPLLQFTVPEALAVIERASVNLRAFLVGNFPLGDRITVAQLMWLYRWRGALQLAEKGYDLWRIVRLLNPISAATHELRERFTRQIYEAGREHLARRLARAFVREVGRAAIDLYGGNLLVTAEQLRGHVTTASQRDAAMAQAREAEPIRILVAGQTGAGKSTLVNALAEAVEAAVDVLPATAHYTAYRLTREGLPTALIIDSPGLTGGEGQKELIGATQDCDLVLWVVSAARAAREVDARALAGIRAHFAAEPSRHRPPMLLVLTHIDQLRPFNEWAPPYDLGAAKRQKAVAIRDAMRAAGRELGFAAEETIPVRADAAVAAYNIDALWAKVMELMPEAQRTRLLRTLEDIRGASAWGAVWSQAANAGRVIAGEFLTRSTNP